MPELDLINFAVAGCSGNPDNGFCSSTKCGEHKVVVDYPEAWGGSDKGPNPMDTIMCGLIGCEQIISTKVAKEHDWTVRNVCWNCSIQYNPNKSTAYPAKQAIEKIHIDAVVDADMTQEEVDQFGEIVHY
ncbi:OsmC/Ohr family protein, partial [Kipferlia bialata]|eukprot:g10018.t1